MIEKYMIVIFLESLMVLISFLYGYHLGKKNNKAKSHDIKNTKFGG